MENIGKREGQGAEGDHSVPFSKVWNGSSRFLKSHGVGQMLF